MKLEPITSVVKTLHIDENNNQNKKTRSYALEQCKSTGASAVKPQIA